MLLPFREFLEHFFRFRCTRIIIGTEGAEGRERVFGLMVVGARGEREKRSGKRKKERRHFHFLCGKRGRAKLGEEKKKEKSFTFPPFPVLLRKLGRKCGLMLLPAEKKEKEK